MSCIIPFVHCCQVARTLKGRKRFQFRITLLDQSSEPLRKPWVGTNRWKHKAMYNIKMYLSIQAEKASNRVAWNWRKYYGVRGYGAPNTLEFMCPFSGMAAKTIRQEEAVIFRKYWANCATKSREIVRWLDSVPPQKYSRELNHYLLRLVIFIPNIREREKYQKRNPYKQVGQWQELQSTTKS